MKKSVVFFGFLILSSVSFASFPVQPAEKTTVSTEQKAVALDNNIQIDKVEAMAEQTLTKAEMKELKKEMKKGHSFLEEKWILVLLWFFLGGFAAHRWYAKKPVGWNILFILTAGGCGVWAIVDLIHILTDQF